MDEHPDDDFVIYRYTRKQAIEDGVLVDVTPTAKEVGFRVSVALTRAVWDQVVIPNVVARSDGQSEAGACGTCCGCAATGSRSGRGRRNSSTS